MILSVQDLFSDKQALTVSCVSTQTIDLGAAGTLRRGAMPFTRDIARDMGQGNPIPLLVQVVESFAGATGVTIELQTANDEAFSQPQTLASQKFAAADLKAGARLALPVVPYGAAKRYLRMNYVVGGTATAGKITASFSMGNDEAAL